MFERYQKGSNPLLDAAADAYDHARRIARALDNVGAMRIDLVRRRERRLARVDRLDLAVVETINALSDLEGEVVGSASADLKDAKTQLQWVLRKIRS